LGSRPLKVLSNVAAPCGAVHCTDFPFDSGISDKQRPQVRFIV
jgi:hypothetical protein